tara:strand:- start:173 stop:592 length:420 start_codon:yes stop_codon:yes gene_type:complete
MDRIAHIKKQIIYPNMEGVYEFKKTKKEVLNYYIKNIDRLNKLPEQEFLKYNFLIEVLKKCEVKEKSSKVTSIYSRVYKLERHKYAPELNKLEFIQHDGDHVYVSAEKQTDIENAVAYLLISMSLKQINNLIETTKIIK